ncbi:hypothetical protein K440DRAFT_314804 [Wilcoxina mikolae CBS 423.85]|nr:hypothetical protein K440DRAFT_314804 [Wilcoxina mikolae CBS 423.85]
MLTYPSLSSSSDESSPLPHRKQRSRCVAQREEKWMSNNTSQRNQATANNNNGNNAGGGNHHIPEPLQHLGLLEEDITATPGPLPGTVDELAEYGLPCFSLRTLEVAGVDGLQFSKKDEFILFRNLASLNTIAGCLGLEIDVKFCQGAGCALGVLEDPDSSDYCIGDGEHHRDSYKRPLPYLPGERFLVDPASGRIFRIPKHCLPQAPGTQQQQQQQPPQPPQNQPPPPPPPPPPGINLAPPANPPQPNTHGFPQHILHIMQQHHHQLQQNHQYQVALQQNQQYHHLMNQVPPPAAPPPPPPPPAAIIPQQPGIAMMRRVRMEPDSSERQGRQVRRVAMLNGPRGLCEGCGRELWLCETCNTFWVLYCGGCAARNPTGAREHQQRRDEDVDVV